MKTKPFFNLQEGSEVTRLKPVRFERRLSLRVDKFTRGTKALSKRGWLDEF
jgi:hypothetical protein